MSNLHRQALFSGHDAIHAALRRPAAILPTIDANDQ